MNVPIGEFVDNKALLKGLTVEIENRQQPQETSTEHFEKSTLFRLPGDSSHGKDSDMGIGTWKQCYCLSQLLADEEVTLVITK